MTSPLLSPVPMPDASAALAEAASGARTTRRDGTSDTRALEAAHAFEKLLIHDLLKAARRAGATLGETPSNARSTYDDMMDERMAEIVSDAGGLGLAPMLAERLDGGADRPRDTTDPDVDPTGNAPLASGRERLLSAVTDGGGHASPTERLDTADLLRLRALVRPDGHARAAGPDAPVADTAGIRPRALDAARPATTATADSPAAAPLATPVGTTSAPSGIARTPDDAHRAFLEPLLPEARRSARRLGTSPDVILAVAALESGWGERVITDARGRSSHNLFGIKARPGEPGAVSHATTEYLGGQRRHVVADFRAFADPASAVGGFADFVLDNPRYAGALEHAGDPPEFLRRLHAAGYATDPRYADKAIAVMQRVRALRENPA